MTREVKVGLNSTGIIDRFHAQSFAFPVLPLELVAVSDLLVEAPEKYSVEYPIPTVYKDRHPFLIDNPSKTVPICLLTNIHAQLNKEPGSTNSISFPPSLLSGAGVTSCSQHFN
jgi:hypothetical protein